MVTSALGALLAAVLLFAGAASGLPGAEASWWGKHVTPIGRRAVKHLKNHPPRWIKQQ